MTKKFTLLADPSASAILIGERGIMTVVLLNEMVAKAFYGLVVEQSRKTVQTQFGRVSLRRFRRKVTSYKLRDMSAVMSPKTPRSMYGYK